MVELSVLEIRFYIGVFLLFLFGIFSVVLLMTGFFWEGVALLTIVVLCSALAYFASKRRCPRCGRLYIDSSFEHCPHCGFPLKKEQN